MLPENFVHHSLSKLLLQQDQAKQSCDSTKYHSAIEKGNFDVDALNYSLEIHELKKAKQEVSEETEWFENIFHKFSLVSSPLSSQELMKMFQDFLRNHNDQDIDPHNDTIVSQPSKCLKFMTFREGCFVIHN